MLFILREQAQRGPFKIALRARQGTCQPIVSQCGLGQFGKARLGFQFAAGNRSDQSRGNTRCGRGVGIVDDDNFESGGMRLPGQGSPGESEAEDGDIDLSMPVRHCGTAPGLHRGGRSR